MVMTRIELRDLSFGYDGGMVFSDVSAVFDRPELVCILGPNGVGKTTLVKCINRLLRPVTGSVEIDGVNISSMGLVDLARRMAYVPNSSSSVFAMSVAEAVLMGRHPHSSWTTSDHDMDVAERAMETMDLQELSSRDIRELSAGQMQRVMIARGLAQEPDVLILDEPTSNLDVRYQMDVMRFLKRYARENDVIVMMVCHDLNITAAYADRVLLMYGGRIYADGTASEVITEENISAVYDVRSKVLDMDGIPHVVLLPEVD